MTFEELKNAKYVEHHKCAICNVPIGYYVLPELVGAVLNTACGCGPSEVNERLISHEELEALCPKQH